VRALRTLAAGLVPLAIVIGGLEVALRLLPGLVPFELLQHFHDDVRLAIAEQLNLPNRKDVTEVPRDDGGPLLRKYLPRQTVTRDFGDKDATSTIVTDSLGYCNPPTSAYERPKIDIIAIGDSLTWCTAVRPQDTWPEFLGRDLKRSVYNLGYPGIGLYEYLVLLRKYGLAKHPGVVVMNFYEGNDLRDAERYWRFKRHEVAAGPRRERSMLDELLGRYSYSYNLLAAAWTQWIAAEPTSSASGHSIGDLRLASIDRHRLDFRYKLSFDGRGLAFNVRNADRDELAHGIAVAENLLSLDVFDDAFKEFARLAEAHGFTPVVTYTPSAHTAYAKYAVFDAPWVGAIMRQYSDKLRAVVGERTRRLGLPFLDLTPLLQQEIERQGPARADKLLYYPGSVHYSVEGNRVAAREIAKFIEGLKAEHRPSSRRASKRLIRASSL
jgi:lysophospholipase L1-like esterase